VPCRSLKRFSPPFPVPQFGFRCFRRLLRSQVQPPSSYPSLIRDSVPFSPWNLFSPLFERSSFVPSAPLSFFKGPFLGLLLHFSPRFFPLKVNLVRFDSCYAFRSCTQGASPTFLSHFAENFQLFLMRKLPPSLSSWPTPLSCRWEAAEFSPPLRSGSVPLLGLSNIRSQNGAPSCKIHPVGDSFPPPFFLFTFLFTSFSDPRIFKSSPFRMVFFLSASSPHHSGM